MICLEAFIDIKEDKCLQKSNKKSLSGGPLHCCQTRNTCSGEMQFTGFSKNLTVIHENLSVTHATKYSRARSCNRTEDAFSISEIVFLSFQVSVFARNKNSPGCCDLLCHIPDPIMNNLIFRVGPPGWDLPLVQPECQIPAQS